jgi:hypothetical protein
MPRPPRLAGWTWCVVLVIVASVGRAISTWGLASPWIAPDEVTYGLLGQSLWHSGTLTFLGAEAPFYGIVYPLIAGLPLTVFGHLDGIRALQVVQPLLMSTAGLVAYVWARRMVPVAYALLAAALTIAVPALTYSGLMMTEVAYYPLATLSLLLAARAIEDPTLERQAVAVATILITSLTRLQGLALLPALASAVVAVAVFERKTRVIRRFAVVLVGIVLGGGLLVALDHAGASHHVLGAYTTTTQTSYLLGPALKWTVWHAGDVLLLVAGIPLLATAVLVVDAARGRERSAAARAMLAVSLSYLLCSVVEVGLFASRFSGTLLERNLITVAPPLFVGFALWLARGLPRPQPSTSIVCLIVIAPALALPTRRLADPIAVPSAFTSLAFEHLAEWISSAWLETIWIGGVVAVTALFLLAPRRRPWLLPAVALVLLGGASVLATRDVRQLAADLRRDLFGSTDPGWIDQSASGPVTYVADGSFFWNAVWIRAYWNPRVEQIVALPAPQPSALPPYQVVSPRFDGTLFTASGERIESPYVLATQAMTFVGTPVRSVRQPVDDTMLTLWKVDPPVRLRMLRSGFAANGDVSRHAQIDIFDCRPGELDVTLLGKDGSPATLAAPGVPPNTAAPHEGVGAHVAVPTPPSAAVGSRCTFSLDSPGLVGTTVVSFVPTS